MSPGLIIMMGVFNIVLGLFSQSIICVVSGLFCLYVGLQTLDKEDNSDG